MPLGLIGQPCLTMEEALFQLSALITAKVMFVTFKKFRKITR